MRTRAEWFGLLGLHNYLTPSDAFRAFAATHYTASSEQLNELLSEPCATMKEAIFSGIRLSDPAVRRMRTNLGVIAYLPIWEQWAFKKD